MADSAVERVAKAIMAASGGMWDSPEPGAVPLQMAQAAIVAYEAWAKDTLNRVVMDSAGEVIERDKTEGRN